MDCVRCGSSNTEEYLVGVAPSFRVRWCRACIRWWPNRMVRLLGDAVRRPSPTDAEPRCDCGALKARTPHVRWCSVKNPR